MGSLRDIEPWLRRSWLAARGLQDFYKQQSWRPDSQGLRCVGRWSYGPAVKVSLRVTPDDTILCLARGSGASIIRFRSRDSLTLDLLSDINCYGIVCRAIIQDTLVFCGLQQGGTGIEVWGISNPASPNRLSYVYLPPIMDIAVKDTLLYAIGYQQDSLRIFNISNPRSPVQMGACAASGFPMFVSGNYCYLADQYGLNILDVSDPANPRRVGNIGGFEALSVAVKDTLCYIGTYIYPDEFRLRVYNVGNPSVPIPVGSLAGIEVPDIYLPPTCDTVLYTPKLHIINISDPRSPRRVGFVDCPGWDYGVVTVPALNYALVADYFEGLVVVDITNPTLPRIDTTLFAADQALDIEVKDGVVFLAGYRAGLQLLDVTVPATPRYLGSYDTVGSSRPVRSASGRDSFAFISWPRPRLLSIDISDPRHPVRAGGCEGMFNPPADMVLRDSFLYCAEANRFEVVNIARPREPVLVGSCVIPDYTWDMDIAGDLAAVAHILSLQLVDITSPSSPRVVGSWGGDVNCVAIVDTIAYAAGPYTGLVALSIANPVAPYVLDSLPMTDTLWWNDVVVVGSVAYVGGELIQPVDVSDPRNLRLLGEGWRPPYLVRRLCYAAPYIYAGCYEAGVCVLETTQVGVKELPRITRHREKVSVVPSITTGAVWLSMSGTPGGIEIVEVYNATGSKMKIIDGLSKPELVCRLDLSEDPAGVYIVRLKAGDKTFTARVIKTQGR